MEKLRRADIVPVDLAQNLPRSGAGTLIALGDQYANRFGAKLTRHGNSVDTDGYKVLGFFIRPDGRTVTIDGAASGDEVYVDLLPECYAYEGRFSLSIKIIGGDIACTVRVIDGYAKITRTDEVVDPGNVIPSFESVFTEEAVANAVDAYLDRDLIQAVVDAIRVEYPGAHVIYGDVGDNNDITLRGDVAPGVYTVSYVNADGSETYIGELKVADDDSVTTVDVPITWLFNVKLSKTTGEVENSNDGDYNASDFIELVSGSKYTVSTQTDTYNSMGVLYYDANKAFIAYQADCWVSNNAVQDPDDGSPQSCALEIPDGAAYIRLRQFETWNEQGASTAYVKLQYTTA